MFGAILGFWENFLQQGGLGLVTMSIIHLMLLVLDFIIVLHLTKTIPVPKGGWDGSLPGMELSEPWQLCKTRRRLMQVLFILKHNLLLISFQKPQWSIGPTFIAQQQPCDALTLICHKKIPVTSQTLSGNSSSCTKKKHRGIKWSQLLLFWSSRGKRWMKGFVEIFFPVFSSVKRRIFLLFLAPSKVLGSEAALRFRPGKFLAVNWFSSLEWGKIEPLQNLFNALCVL